MLLYSRQIWLRDEGGREKKRKEQSEEWKLLCGSRAEEKAHCDWQMTQEQETPERPRFTPTCLKACRQTYLVIIEEWLNYVPLKMWQNQKVFEFNMHKAKPLSMNLMD